MRLQAVLPVAWIFVCAVACERALEIPPPPVDLAPVVRDFEPKRAFAGQTVTLEIDANGALDLLEVRFGASRPVPLQPADAGFRAVVPDDATDGVLAVSNRAGSAVSAENFDFLGPGHLQEGRITAKRVLAPAFALSLASETRHATFFQTTAPSAAIQLDEAAAMYTLHDIEGGVPVGFTISPDGHRLVVLARASKPCAEAGRPGLAITVHELGPAPEQGVLPLSLARVCLGFEADVGSFTGLATDTGAAHVVVAPSIPGGGHRIVLADVASGESVFRESSERVTDPVLAGDAFLILDGTSLLRIDPDAAPDSWESVSANRDDGPPTALASARDGTLALGFESGLVLVSEPVWPPAFTTEVDPISTVYVPGWDYTRVASIALSPDAQSIVVSQDVWSRVVVLRRTSTGWTPLAEHLVSRPGRVAAAANGTFNVVTAAGVVQLSGLSGARTVSYTTGAFLRSLRATRCPDGSEALAVGATSFSLVQRLQPGTLADACEPLHPVGDDEFTEIETDVATGTSFSLWRTGEIGRTTVDGHSESNTRVPKLEDYWERQLLLSRDGARLWVAHFVAGRVLELDARAEDWSAAVPLRDLDFGRTFVAARLLGDGSLAVAQGSRLILLPPGDGAERVVDAGAAIGNLAVVGEDLLVLSAPVGSQVTVQVLDQITGTLRDAGVIGQADDVRSPVGSADGTRLYAIVVHPSTQRVLVRPSWDPVTKRLGPGGVPIFLHNFEDLLSARELLPSADGSRLWLLDTYGDSVWVIE